MSLASSPTAIQTESSSASPWFHNPWFVFAIALALRFALIFNFHLYRLPATPHHHFQFGWEMGRVARALTSGRGFADPFYGHTGPTAWVAPLYPYLMAGVFRIFGIYSVTSAMTLMLLNAFIGAVTIFPIRAIASRCFSRKVAIASIWIWAVWPFTMRYIAYLQDMSLSTLLFTCAIAMSLRMRGVNAASGQLRSSPATLRQWSLFGLLWGILALADPAPLLCLPACFLWILAGSWRPKDPALFRRQFLRAVWAVIICVGCIAPWTIRNAIVFHTFLPMRSDLGEEIYQGNGPGSNGVSMVWEHPYYSPKEYRLYDSMGEVAYCHMRGAEATKFIHQFPEHFVFNTLRRVDYFWFGLPQPNVKNLIEYAPIADLMFMSLCGLLGLALALHSRRPGAVLLGWIMLLYPLTYYLIIVEPHHRYLLDPLLCILALYLWTSAEESNRVRWLMPSWWRARFAPGR